MKGLESRMLGIYRQKISPPKLLLILFSLFATPVGFTATHHWQGPYVGAYFGGGFGNNHVSTDAGTVTSSSYFTTAADINAVKNAGTSTNTPDTVITGIQAGHDWVWNQMIYGVAADYGVQSLSSSNTVSNIYPDNSNSYSVYTSMSTNWLFTLRGRLGYEVITHWPSLLYLTGGMAMTQLKINNSFSDNSSLAGKGGNNTSQNQIGWTAGAGIELAAFEHATIDLEYAYVSMPSVKVYSSISNSAAGFGVPAQSLTSPFTSTGEFHASLLKLGLNYRFDE